MNSYFSGDSVIRRVHSERALALYGPRALLMQAAHPLAVAGLLAHTSGLEEPYARLSRTARAMHTIVFGSKVDADRVARRVRAMHSVRGRLATNAGPYPAGTPYRANDPELLMWVLYTLVDSASVVYRKYVGNLDEAALWEDYQVIGRLLGMRRRDMPDDLQGYGREMLEGDTLHVSPWAKRQARQIVLEPPAPLWARPLVDTVGFITIALLPDRIRRGYGFSALPPPLVRSVLVAAHGEYVKRAIIPLLPERVRYVPRSRAA